jgi:hypothetical protein
MSNTPPKDLSATSSAERHILSVIKSFGSAVIHYHSATNVAVIALRCQYAFSASFMVIGSTIRARCAPLSPASGFPVSLRCHSWLTVIVALKQLNDGRKA